MAQQMLVSTDWLHKHLDDNNLRVLDIRGRVQPASEPPPHYYSHRADYEQSHIPGSLFVDWTRDIVEPGSPSYDVANPQRYADLMSRLGVGDETQIVAYDDANGMFAARLWWTLNYYGHAQVAVLDGGWQKWLAEKRPTTDIIPDVQPTTFTPRINSAWHSSADEVLKQPAQLLDVRSTAEYNGAASRVQRKGHIPGALNLPRKQLLATDGTLLAPNALRQAFTQAGIDLNTTETIVYCNSGVSASFALLALHVAGMQGGSVYDGSWRDWANDADKPIT